MIILGIESSCDETGVGIVELSDDGHVRVLADQVASSMGEHAAFGGVVPEIASRAHLEAMPHVMDAAMREAGIAKPDAVVATVGPGLAGALLVGAAAAKGYAAGWGVDFYGVNHLGGHVAVATLDGEELDHCVALLVSGGHTQILEVTSVGKPMREIGSTLDDAAGEAYDKVARLLHLGYPGGPVIDKLAQRGNPQAIAFPRGLMKGNDHHSEHRHDFSFSGLKTAVARYIETAEAEGRVISVEDVCASFQEAVADVVSFKTVRAAQEVGAKTVLLGGGVAANSRVRSLLEQRCADAGIQLRVPPLRLCTDNGVMIAALGAALIRDGARPSSLAAATVPGLAVSIPVVE
ncbi:tRNA (adenosine(37)-N6)-threonylcarbamoyltransferase complex transferase subunit TsaD [Corynebacterium tapiri]|uniref:tRNA N6-adenosine threonylcarbamoyltransferase n=1 Tax=Corynebacterium tapiri TaxID=1448266 RepID=A0A5C4U582_9CORY|nr:tRNA (adenosine(37)-N6)-threonylcarbamoyltransferase complex transferase subunit TsaD [Corynebacterium tapiri]TNL98505.1 tRNA (adenosine(37)-N6)-threonylcarbamoyltransferase complex transferase subunit TsaD [Corynebacterium tapiri]